MNVEILWKIIDILTTILSCVLYFWFINKISMGKKNNIYVAIAYISFFCIMMVSQFLYITPLLKIILIFGICNIFIKLGYRISMKYILIGSLCDIVISSLTELLIVGTLFLLNGFRSIENISERWAVYVQAILLSKLINFILLVLVVRRMNPKALSFNEKDTHMFIAHSLFYTISMYLIIEITILTDRNDLYIMLIILFFIVLACYFDNYVLSCSRAKNRIMNEEYRKELAYSEQLFQYSKQKEASQINVQKLTHDMKHYILALQGMIKKTESWKAQNYLNQIEDVFKENERYFDTGCSLIDVILSEKISQAEHCGINVNILYEPECLKKYEELPLCSIMGNVLDNAIRAVNENVSDEKWIDIKIRLDKENKVLIIVNNPYCGMLKKKDGKLMTTKRDKEGHGLGLKCIEDAVKSYNGEMSIINEDHVFSLMIII